MAASFLAQTALVEARQQQLEGRGGGPGEGRGKIFLCDQQLLPQLLAGQGCGGRRARWNGEGTVRGSTRHSRQTRLPPPLITHIHIHMHIHMHIHTAMSTNIAASMHTPSSGAVDRGG